MKCPLLKSRYNVQDEVKQWIEKAEFQECIDKECSWWNGEKNMCSLKAISKVLTIQIKMYE